MFQGTKTFLNRPRKSWPYIFLEHHGNRLVILGIWYSLYLPRVHHGLRDSAQIPHMYLSLLLPYASVLMVALLPNGYHLTCLLKISREKYGSNWEFWLCTWQGNHGGVTLLVKWMQNMRLYQPRVIFKTAHFQTIKFSSWKHGVAERAPLYLQMKKRGSESILDTVRSLIFSKSDKLRTIKVSLCLARATHSYIIEETVMWLHSVSHDWKYL